jgi:TP901 family phage tail tape measure protein
MTGAVSTLTIKLQDDVSAPAAKVAAALKKAEAEAKAISNAIKDSGISNRLGQALAKIGMSAGDITKVGTAWKDYARAAGQGADATKWTSANKAHMKLWENASIGSLRAVQREQAKMVEMNKNIQKVVSLHPPATKEVIEKNNGKHGDTLSAAAIALAAKKAKDAVKKDIKTYAHADDSLTFQAIIAELTPQEKASRAKQGIELGPKYGLKPTDIYEAQETLAARGVKKQFVEPFTEQLVGYANSMKIPLKEAAKTLEALLFTTNQHIDNAATAGKVVQKQIDIMVKASKMSGLDDPDLKLGIKFGAGSAHGAGLENEDILAIMAALKRGGYEGDLSGTGIRTMMSRLLSPTRKGREAMQINGIDYANYATHPENMGVDGIEGLMKSRFGTKISSEQRHKLEAVLDDSDVVNKPDEFVAQVSEILQDSFAKNKNGKTKAQDSQKIAKLATDYLQQTTSSLDTGRLFMDILKKNIPMQALNAIFTSAHGPKAGVLSERIDAYVEILEALKHVKEGFANDIAQKRMESVDGSLKRLDASTEAFTLQVASANASLIKFSADLASSALAKASQADPATLQTGTAVASGITAAAVISAGSAYFSGAGVAAAIAAGAGTAAGILGSPVFLTALAGAGLYKFGQAIDGQKTIVNPRNEPTKGMSYENRSDRDAIMRLARISAKEREADPEGARGRAMQLRDNRERASITPSILSSEYDNSFDSLKTKAEETGVAVKTALTVTPTITINTDAISAASAQVDALLAKLAQISSAASRIGPMINNLQQRMNSSFSE